MTSLGDNRAKSTTRTGGGFIWLVILGIQQQLVSSSMSFPKLMKVPFI
jgi:hypothetical protein